MLSIGNALTGRMSFTLSVLQPDSSLAARLIFPVLLLFAVVIAARMLSGLSPKRKTSSADDALPYKARAYLFSKAERSFYEVLRRVVEPGCSVFAKVRLADLLIIPKGTPNWQTHFNRIQSKHVDFVICDSEAIRVLAVVELDDSSHSAANRQTRDAFVDRALAAAGVPMFRVKARDGYVPSDIRELLAEALRAAQSV